MKPLLSDDAKEIIWMAVFIGIIILCMCSLSHSQDNCYWYDTCQDCPQPGDIECVLNPNYCQQCWDTCGEEWRCDPVPVTLPRGVGVWGVHPPYIRAFENQMRKAGIRNVTVWIDDNPIGNEWCWHGDWCWDNRQKMEDFWTSPNIDTIFVRFDSIAWAGYEKGSDLSGNQHNITFATEPTYDIATALFDYYGYLDKTIIFVDWEMDNQIYGQGGEGYYEGGPLEGLHRYPWLDGPSWYGWGVVPYPDTVPGPEATPCIEERMNELDETAEQAYNACGDMLLEMRATFVKSEIERRQVAIEHARAEHPDATLKIYSAAVVNQFPGHPHDVRPVPTVTEMIPTMEHPPDLIGLSYWDFNDPITNALDWIEETTGYDRGSIFVMELGGNKDKEQYDRIFNETRRAWCWGVGMVNIFNWRQTHVCADLRPNGKEKNNFGLFYQRQPCEEGEIRFKGKRPGFYAVQDLLAYNFNPDECEEILALPPTRE